MSSAPTDFRRSAADWSIRVGLVLGLGAALIVSGFAGDEAVAAPLVLGDPRRAPNMSMLWYGGGLVALFLVQGVAAWVARRDPGRRRFVWWLVGVSAAGVLWFGWLAALSTGFYAAARVGISQAELGTAGVLFTVAFAAPSIASLIAAALTAVRTRTP